MIEYVCGFAFGGEAGELVVLIRKNRPAWQQGKLNGIGGHVEQGESYHDAMVREFEEETGLNVPHWDQFLTLEGVTWRCTFFRAFDVDVFKVESKTDEEVCRYHVTELPENVLANIPWLVPLALDTEPIGPNVVRYNS